MAHDSDPYRNQSPERALPHNAEAERAILGAIILDDRLIHQANELLRVEDFYAPSHRRIFAAMLALADRNSQIDPIVIGQELMKEGFLEAVGGVTFITELSRTPHSTNIAHYAKIVRGQSLLRQLVKTANQITAEALEQEEEPDVIFDHAEEKILQLRGEVNNLRPGLRTYRQVSGSVSQMFEAWSAGKLVAVPTQIPEIDRRLVHEGLAIGDFAVFAGLTSYGKTALALQVALNTSRAGIPVLIFSLEMPAERLFIRNLSSVSNIARKEIAPHTFRHHHTPVIESIKSAQPSLEELPIQVGDRVRSLSRLISIAHDWKVRTVGQQSHNLGLIIVDYMQLVQNRLSRRSREEEVSGISRELKALASELSIPLIGISQFNRNPARQNQRPELTDLRESGAIEQDVDLALFIWSPNKLTEDPVRAAKIYCAKQRDGQVGWEEDIDFDADHQWFRSAQMWRHDAVEMEFNN